MSVAARFYVDTITRRAYNPDHVEVTLKASSRGEENKTWAQFTPSGEMKMTINNPAAAEFFADNLGRDLALRFETVADEAPYTSEHQEAHAVVNARRAAQ